MLLDRMQHTVNTVHRNRVDRDVIVTLRRGDETLHQKIIPASVDATDHYEWVSPLITLTYEAGIAYGHAQGRAEALASDEFKAIIQATVASVMEATREAAASSAITPESSRVIPESAPTFAPLAQIAPGWLEDIERLPPTTNSVTHRPWFTIREQLDHVERADADALYYSSDRGMSGPLHITERALNSTVDDPYTLPGVLDDNPSSGPLRVIRDSLHTDTRRYAWAPYATAQAIGAWGLGILELRRCESSFLSIVVGPRSSKQLVQAFRAVNFQNIILPVSICNYLRELDDQSIADDERQANEDRWVTLREAVTGQSATRVPLVTEGPFELTSTEIPAESCTARPEPFRRVTDEQEQQHSPRLVPASVARDLSRAADIHAGVDPVSNSHSEISVTYQRADIGDFILAAYAEVRIPPPDYWLTVLSIVPIERIQALYTILHPTRMYGNWLDGARIFDAEAFQEAVDPTAATSSNTRGLGLGLPRGLHIAFNCLWGLIFAATRLSPEEIPIRRPDPVAEVPSLPAPASSADVATLDDDEVWQTLMDFIGSSYQ
jgi:hypothetical protein